MTKKQSNLPPPDISQRPAPPQPPPVRGIPLLASTIVELYRLEEYRQADIRGEIRKFILEKFIETHVKPKAED